MINKCYILDPKPFFADLLPTVSQLGWEPVFITKDSEINLAEFEEGKIPTRLRQSIKPVDRVQFWTTSEAFLRTASRLNDNFGGHNAHPFDLLNRISNKYAIRQLLQGTPYNPAYQVVSRDSFELGSFKQGKSYIIKPLRGVSSFGIVRVNDLDELSAKLKESFASTIRLRKRYGVSTEDAAFVDNHLLVEEFVDGKEVAVDVLLQEGQIKSFICNTKTPMPGPYFEEKTYFVPGQVTDEERCRLKLATEAIVTILGVKTGPVHIEFKLTDNRIIFIDIGLRLGGQGLTHYLIKVAYGINYIEYLLKIIFGQETPSLLDRSPTAGAFLYLHTVGQGGVIDRVSAPLDCYPQFGARVMHKAMWVARNDLLSPFPMQSGAPGFALFKTGTDLDTQAFLEVLEQGEFIKYRH